MAERTTGGFRLDLGEPLASELADFCVAHYKAPQTEIIRAALRVFIDRQLTAEPEMRKRYDDARQKRLAEKQ
jgi:predicted SpoU family rRNA methylase